MVLCQLLYCHGVSSEVSVSVAGRLLSAAQGDCFSQFWWRVSGQELLSCRLVTNTGSDAGHQSCFQAYIAQLCIIGQLLKGDIEIIKGLTLMLSTLLEPDPLQGYVVLLLEMCLDVGEGLLCGVCVVILVHTDGMR